MSNNLKNINILIVGTSQMAQEYIKILDYMDLSFQVVGRGLINVKKCEENTGFIPFRGGIDNFLKTNNDYFSHAIVAVGVDQLFNVSSSLIKYGVGNILIEKPGSLFKDHLNILKKISSNKSKIYIAYNRRFFSSTIKAREIINEDNGLLSFNFEFTEWSHIIENLKKPKVVMEKWFLSNSTHVADLAFSIGGFPVKMASFSKGSLSWHKTSSIFSGAGITENDAIFSYNANWESSGRWGVEFLTSKNKLILRPLEKLQVQKKGSLEHIDIEIDDHYDKKFKPGLFRQVRAFLDFENSNFLCSLEEQIKLFSYYSEIANYRY